MEQESVFLSAGGSDFVSGPGPQAGCPSRAANLDMGTDVWEGGSKGAATVPACRFPLFFLFYFLMKLLLEERIVHASKIFP